MQKRKLNKNTQVSKLAASELPHMLFDSIMQDLDMESAASQNSFGQIASSTITTAIELLKIVVENKIRNAEQMIDKDIYDIYKKSFSTVIKVASTVDEE